MKLYHLEVLQSKGVYELPTGVGFSYLPNWRMTKARHEEHFLNLIILGRPESGRRTLINLLFNKEIVQSGPLTELFNTFHAELAENGVRLTVNVTIVEGYGIPGKKTDTKAIIDFVSHGFKDRLSREMAVPVKDKHPQKDSIHAAIMIAPRYWGGAYAQWEIELALELQQYLVVIPVITKADTLTEWELSLHKTTILTQWEKAGLFSIAHLVDIDGADEEEWLCREFERVFAKLPFAVIASDQRMMDFPWGSLQIDRAESHSSMSELQMLLVNMFYQHLQRWVNRDLYEHHRYQMLTGNNSKRAISVCNDKREEPKDIPRIAISETFESLGKIFGNNSVNEDEHEQSALQSVQATLKLFEAKLGFQE